MKIGIIGPGSIGLLFAAKLKKADEEVTLIDYKKDRTEFLNTNGIKFEGIDERFQLNVPVKCGFSEINNFDLIIISVKAYSTEKTAADLQKNGYSGPVLTLQNGLGNVEVLKTYLPENMIIAGITSEGANLKDTGHICHAGKGKTSFGYVSSKNKDDSFINELFDAMMKSGFNSEISNDVNSLIWSKLIINVGINALTAILNVKNGMLVESESSRILIKKLVNEACIVSDKLKIKLPYPDPVKKVEEICRMTAENFSSMNQDIKFGRQTEINFINGAVIKAGKKLGLECKYNEIITDIIHSLETLKAN